MDYSCCGSNLDRTAGGGEPAHRRPSRMQVRRGCRALCAGDGGETEVGLRSPHAGPYGDAPARGSGALLSWVLPRFWDACWLQCCSSPCMSSCVKQLRVPRINTESPVPPCGRWGSILRGGGGQVGTVGPEGETSPQNREGSSGAWSRGVLGRGPLVQHAARPAGPTCWSDSQ